MERTEAELIHKFLEYEHNLEAMQAMSDILVYMGMYEAPQILRAALEQKQDKEQQVASDFLAYQQFLRDRKASEFITFKEYLRQYR